MLKCFRETYCATLNTKSKLLGLSYVLVSLELAADLDTQAATVYKHLNNRNAQLLFDRNDSIEQPVA